MILQTTQMFNVDVKRLKEEIDSLHIKNNLVVSAMVQDFSTRKFLVTFLGKESMLEQKTILFSADLEETWEEIESMYNEKWFNSAIVQDLTSRNILVVFCRKKEELAKTDASLEQSFANFIGNYGDD